VTNLKVPLVDWDTTTGNPQVPVRMSFGLRSVGGKWSSPPKWDENGNIIKEVSLLKRLRRRGR
jgi:hypothetical protein